MVHKNFNWFTSLILGVFSNLMPASAQALSVNLAFEHNQFELRYLRNPLTAGVSTPDFWYMCDIQELEDAIAELPSPITVCDRFQQADHVNPSFGRPHDALSLQLTPQTRQVLMDTIGKRPMYYGGDYVDCNKVSFELVPRNSAALLCHDLRVTSLEGCSTMWDD